MIAEQSDYSSLRESILDGSSSLTHLVSEHLQRIKEQERLNAFITVFEDRALRQAKETEKRIGRGERPALAGMILAVKDNMCIRDTVVTCASDMLRSFVSVYDATVIRKLTEAGAIVIGKTNMDEFAMGSSNETSAYGPVRNPRNPEHVSGGSSGGSAAAVAANLAMAALGSDTGGSIRQPASFTGVYGLKPTYGRVSRYGLVAFASSFDQIGPIARSVRDLAALLNVIAGHDPLDSTSSETVVPDFLASLSEDISGLTIGLPKEYFTDELRDDVRNIVEYTIDALRQRGAAVKEISLPHTPYTIATYYILTTAEASSNLARYDGARYGHRSEQPRDLADMYVRSRTEGFGEEVKRRIMLGTFVLSSGYYDAYYRKAQRVRSLIKDDFDRAFGEVDCIATPVSPTTAFRFGEKADPLQMYLTDIYTTSANLAGIPGISIPAGVDGTGLPVGLQLLGRQFDEQTLLNAAYALSKVPVG
jgi:aspartyl-tRNA(Asn)/glutamyl-tRNA(Gln) amidotransferase subunit A